MARDFGERGRRRGIGFAGWTGSATVLIAVAAFGATWAYQRPIGIREAEQWGVEGPPCPELTAEQVRRMDWPELRAFPYGEATLARGYGHAACHAIRYNGGRNLTPFPAKYAVCHFSKPSVIAVKTHRGDRYFAPGAEPAAILMPRGEVRCVMSSKFQVVIDRSKAEKASYALWE